MPNLTDAIKFVIAYWYVFLVLIFIFVISAFALFGRANNEDRGFWKVILLLLLAGVCALALVIAVIITIAQYLKLA